MLMQVQRYPVPLSTQQTIMYRFVNFLCRKLALLGVWVDVGYFVLACHVRRSQKDLPLVWIGLRTLVVGKQRELNFSSRKLVYQN